MKFEIFTSREPHPDFVSKMIMKKLGTPYSHVGILVDGSVIWHATGAGFDMEPIHSFLEKREFVHRVEIPVENLSLAKGWLLGARGKEYSSSQYLGFLAPRLAKFISNGSEKLICSEAVMLFLRDCCDYDLVADTYDLYDPRHALEAARDLAAKRGAK